MGNLYGPLKPQNPVESFEKYWLMAIYLLSCSAAITTIVGPIASFVLALVLRNKLSSDYALSHVRRHIRTSIVSAIAMAASLVFMVAVIMFMALTDIDSSALFILAFVPVLLVILFYFYKTLSGFVQLMFNRPVI
ncbi:hypothetical protein N9W78_01645 [bacterium]|nr:hypothetical protein [bacterium]